MWPLHSPKIPILAVDTFHCLILNAVGWVLWIVKLDMKCCSNTTLCNILQRLTPISKYNEKTNTTCKKSDKQQIYRFFLNLLRSQDTVLKTVKMTMSVVVNKFFLLLLSIDKFDSWRLRWSQCSFSQLLKILSKNLVVSYCAYVQSFLGTLTTVLWKIICPRTHYWHLLCVGNYDTHHPSWGGCANCIFKNENFVGAKKNIICYFPLKIIADWNGLSLWTA